MTRRIAVPVTFVLAATLAACGGGGGGGGGDVGAAGPAATPSDAFVTTVKAVVDQGQTETTEPQDTSSFVPTANDTAEPVAVGGAAG